MKEPSDVPPRRAKPKVGEPKRDDWDDVVQSRRRYFEYLKAYIRSRTGGEVRIARFEGGGAEFETYPSGAPVTESEIACAHAIALGASHGATADQTPWRRDMLDSVLRGFR